MTTDAPRVRLLLVPDRNVCQIREPFVGGGRFQEFKQAIAGAYYDRKAGATIVGLDKLPAIQVRLRKARFDAKLEPDLLEAIESWKVQHWFDRQTARERIRAVDRELREATRTKEDPEGKGLRPYQKTGCEWLSLRYGALLADQQRLGKTVQALVALPANVPVVVVCPASVKQTWVKEVRKWRPHLKTTVLQGRNSFRWAAPGEIVITNYDVLPEIHLDHCGYRDREGFHPGWIAPKRCPGCKKELEIESKIEKSKSSQQPAAEIKSSQQPAAGQNGKLSSGRLPGAGCSFSLKTGHLESCTGFLKPRRCPGCHPILTEMLPHTVLLGDEIHKVKGAHSKRALRFRGIAEPVRAKEGRTWGFSGTPLQNGPMELWYVFKALGIAEEAFVDQDNFKRIFKGKQIDQFGTYAWGIPGSEAVDCIRKVAMRRTRAEVFPDLPPKIWEEEWVEIDKEALRRCDVFVRETGGLERLEKHINLKKITFETMSIVSEALATAKIPALLDLLADRDDEDPVLVWSMHREPIERLAQVRGWEAIHGGVPVEKRQAIVDRFQAGKLKGLACMIQSAGEGLQLSRAGCSIFVDESWNPFENEQAEDRMVDVEKKRGDLVIRLIAKHPLDDRLREIHEKKRRIFDASVEASRVRDDAPALKTGLEEALKRLRAESHDVPRVRLSADPAIRRSVSADPAIRSSGSPADDRTTGQADPRQAILGLLHTLQFHPQHEPVARDLCQEAEAIGLSELGWEIARAVSALGFAETLDAAAPEEQKKPSRPRGKEKGNDAEREKKSSRHPAASQKDGMILVGEDPHLPDCGMVTETDSVVCTCGSVPALMPSRMEEDEMARLEKAIALYRAMDKVDRVKFADEVLAAMDAEEREEFFDRAEEDYCVRCGEPAKDDEEHECIYGDEDEDEAEDDEDTDDEDEDEDEADDDEDEAEDSKGEVTPS